MTRRASGEQSVADFDLGPVAVQGLCLVENELCGVVEKFDGAAPAGLRRRWLGVVFARQALDRRASTRSAAS